MTTMTAQELKEKISRILIEWSMPTRQVAINDIVRLFESEKSRFIDEILAAPEMQEEDYVKGEHHHHGYSRLGRNGLRQQLRIRLTTYKPKERKP